METFNEKSNIIHYPKKDTFCTFPADNGFCLRPALPFEWRCDIHDQLYIFNIDNDVIHKQSSVVELFPNRNDTWGDCYIDLLTRNVFDVEFNALGRLLCQDNTWFMD